MPLPRPISWLLRIAIAFAFAYPAVAGFLNPPAWVGWFPPFIQGVLPAAALLSLWGAVEIVIAGWILTGKRIFIPALAAAVMLAGIIIFNFGAMDVVFRDVSLMLVAIALAVAGYRSADA